MEKILTVGKCHNHLWFVLLIFILLSFILLLFDNTALTGRGDDQNGVTFLVNNFVNHPVTKQPKSSSLDLCSGRYIYMHHLPTQFNDDLLRNCRSLVKWNDMCPYISNMGLGPSVDNNPENVLSKKGWFSTNQFTLEVIFHNRMKHYECLTNDSSLASAIYVPFYAGLDVGRHLWGFNISVRDASSYSLLKWLSQKPEWRRMWGRDHFLVGGRISWDFRRKTEDDSDWGSKLMFLPESKNMTLLSIESSSWNNDFAIPYPTYFHPSKKSQVIRWQKKMRRTKRRYLFSFAGAPRPNSTNSIRSELIDQCQSSPTCNFLGCFNGASKCDDPVNVMKAFQSSVFCLQPPGDSYTRRSTFDSILAGCIPVFFHTGSAYKQYLWHLPENYTKYSVMIPLNDVKEKRGFVNETLLRVPKKVVLGMREEVIKLIPRIVYGDPRSRRVSFEDAFEIAVKGILERVERVRRKIKEGMDPSIGFSELNGTKL
ncbi:probable xyloglucan galactosyltransferase GT14 [Alnus glutinosa]|uniref:probable xyloglucan galactosyltransferase GT14 n=1 Tax=Alnus glutinosa TaxID=3517 RepID=UPI002D765C99|nr:probable xyloglucan galactosyltransferase GT14 [Alnus glutinosa]